MISRFTSVMNSKLYGPSAQVTHISGEAQWRRGWPSALTWIQSGCARCASSYVACGSVRAIDDHAELAAACDEFAEGVACRRSHSLR